MYNVHIWFTVLKSWTFSVVNHCVLHGHCDRLRNFLTHFVINCGQFLFFKDTFRRLLRTVLVFWHNSAENVNKPCNDRQLFVPFYWLTTILQIINKEEKYILKIKHSGIWSGLFLLQTPQIYLLPNSHHFPQLITEHSVIKQNSNRNVCDR